MTLTLCYGNKTNFRSTLREFYEFQDSELAPLYCNKTIVHDMRIFENSGSKFADGFRDGMSGFFFLSRMPSESPANRRKFLSNHRKLFNLHP